MNFKKIYQDIITWTVFEWLKKIGHQLKKIIDSSMNHFSQIWIKTSWQVWTSAITSLTFKRKLFRMIQTMILWVLNVYSINWRLCLKRISSESLWNFKDYTSIITSYIFFSFQNLGFVWMPRTSTNNNYSPGRIITCF